MWVTPGKWTRRWVDLDRRGIGRGVRLWRDKLSENAEAVVPRINKLKPCRPRNFSKRNMRAWCGGCGVDTSWDGLGEWYTVKNAIWERVWPETSNGKLISKPNGPRHFLCIGCLEERLGRTLTSDDFEEGNILNRPQRGQSKRLRDRLKGERR
jgi:hypothetical protein